MSGPFKMNPGRGPMQKTGRGIPQTFQSTTKQEKQKDPKDPVSGFGAAYASARKGGKKTFDYQGKPYSTLSKEEAESDLSFGNNNISNFKGENSKFTGRHFETGEDTKKYQYYPYMGWNNAQIDDNVQNVIDTQKNAAHALGRGGEATTFENPFEGYSAAKKEKEAEMQRWINKK